MLLAEDDAAIVVGLVEARIEFEGAVIIRDGAIEIAFRLIGVAAIGEEVGLRRQPDRFGVIAIARS